MKYSVAILLALFGIAAASFLNNQDDVKGRVPITKRHNHHHDDDDHKYIMDEINVNEYKKFDNEHSGKSHHKVDKTFLLKQKTVLQLLSNLNQKNVHEHLVQIGNNFDPVEYINKVNNKVAVKKFFKNYENNNFLPLDEVFTPTNQHHQNQAAQLFAFIYSAQDWHTLVQAAAWSRDRFNPEQFAYVFTAVVLNHPTTQGIVIPALYEIIPHAFIPATALHKIYSAKVQGYEKFTVKVNYTNQNQNNNNYNNEDLEMNENFNVDVHENTWGPHNPNHVFADNTGSFINHAGIAENPENKMSYFTEDIGINDIHARFHIQYPLFFGVHNNKNYYTSNLEYMNKENTINKLDIKRGEAFYFAHQQLYARYVLERLSNNLPIPHPINFNNEIKTGYNPNLQHANGQAVPVRPPYTKFEQQQVEDNNNNLNALLPNNNQAQKPQVYEKRIQEAAESGIVFNHDGTKTKLNKVNAVGVLANLIAAPASSLNPDYYGDYFSTAKHAIGNIVDPNNQNGVAPGVVSKYTTAARDPAYYQFLAKLNLIFKNLQNKQGPYTKPELVFPGVKIENVEVSNLVTYFDTVKVNVNNAIPTVNKKHNDNIENANMDYNVKFQRLTNKPFNVKMIVKSDKTTDAIVRVFLGPKYDSNGQRFTLAQASQYFVQLDQFHVKLTEGENVIVKKSVETNVNAQEPTSFKKLWNRVELALQGQQPFYMIKGEHQVLGLPLRNQLPKGTKTGQQFVLYVTINSVNKMYNDDFNMDMSKEETMDIVSDELYYKNHNKRSTMDSNEMYYKNDKHSTMDSDEMHYKNDKHNNMDSDEMYYKNDKYNNMESSEKYNVKTSDNVDFFNYVRDHRSIGFPFDRPVIDVNYNTANQYFKTVTVYHKVNNEN